MSVAKSVNVLCDKCGEKKFTGVVGEGTRVVRAMAKHDGWKLGKQKDFCPVCAKEIAETIKQASQGNL